MEMPCIAVAVAAPFAPGTAMSIMEELADNLGLSYQWTEIAYMEQEPVTVGTFTVPATIIKSACRGEARKTSAPNRAMS